MISVVIRRFKQSGGEEEMIRKILKIAVPFVMALTLVMGCFNITFAADPVSGFKVKIGARAAKASWSAYDGATRYVVKCAGESYKTKNTSYKIGDLTPNTKYSFVVEAYKGKTLLARSAIISGTTEGVRDVEKFTAHSGYKSITLTFKKVKGASYYELYRKNNKTGKFRKIKTLTSKNNTDKKYSTKQIFYTDKGKDLKEQSEREILRNVKYTYKVRAVKKVGDKKWVSNTSTASAKAVRQMYQDIKVNGRWHTANGYSGGTYYTIEGNSYSVTSVSSATADYWRNKNYSKRSAENFVNELMKAGKFSRGGKKRMIWISTYTQHIYVYKWNARKKMWKIQKHFECSTGKPGSATPMGFNKEIGHKHRSRHGISWWSCFSSHNAMHGKHSGWVIDGTPQSGGCVRNLNENAEWIYDHCSNGTPVVSW